MARENLDGIESYPAAGDLSANGYSFVSLNGSAQVAATAAGAVPDGKLDNPADVTASGKMARVVSRVGVRMKIKAGTGGVTVGALGSVGANGSVVISVTQGHARVCKILTAAAAGELAEVHYHPGIYSDVP